MSRVKTSIVIKVVALVFYFLLAFFLAKSQGVSDFSVDDENWKAINNNTGATTPLTYNTTGGNPASSGYVSFTTSAGNVNIYFVAPSKFIGNQSRAYNQTLTFDLQVSTTGTDNSNGDVIITSPSGTLFYQLPTKPSSTLWSSYSVSLNESVWHNGSIGGAAPTQAQMKQILANITNFQIRLKYFSGNTFPYTGQLDNVVLNQLALGTPPTITSFTPTAALTGATVTLTGTNFNSTAAQNLVYFNGIKATVSSATSTQLSVTVPTSAAFGPITVVNFSTGLQATSVQSFNPLFDNNKDFGGRIIPASLGRGHNVILPMSASASNSSGRMDKGDLDGDGLVDLITTETSTKSIYVFKNLGSGGSVSASSFSSPLSLSLATIPGGGPYLAEAMVVDVDSDGKLDIAASTANNSTGFLAVYRNTSTVGSISFASPVFFSYNYYNPLTMAAGDLDGDGRTDFVFTSGSAPSNVFISQNLSTPGNIDFAFGVSISAASTGGYSDIVIGDLTGDGKPEIVCPGYNAATLFIYENNSTPGTITMGTVFTIPAVVSYTNQLAIADLDADNKPDMVWSTYGSQYVYFSKNIYAGGAFDATAFGATIQITNTLSNPLGITVGDINADGKPDVIMSGYNDLAVLQNVGSTGNLNSTSFLPTTLFQGSATTTSIFGLSPIVADVDGDNKPEAIFVSSGGGPLGIYIFHNESYPAPSITSVTPTSANAGAAISLNGNLMFTGNVNPSVRLNKTLSTITGIATNILTTITNPTTGISGKFNVTSHGLSAISPYFNKTFGTARVITASSFGPSIDFTLAINTRDALEIADFDDDGKMDVMAIDNFSTVKIFQNAATAGQPITASSLSLQGTTYTGSYNMVALDIDGDGKVDLNNGYGLLQNNSTSGTISFLSGPNGVNTNAGGFNYVAQADFNKDGKIDLAVTSGSANIQVYENKSSRGVFVNNSNLSTYAVTAVNLTRPGNNGGIVAEDFDGDGFDDLIVANQSTNNLTYYLNTKAYGTITASSFSFLGNYSTSGSQPIGLTANDFDGDGKIDIAVTYNNSTFVSVYLNNSVLGDISFSTSVDLTSLNKGYNIASQDLDGDGKAEIVVIHRPNPGPGSFSIFQNKSTIGNASFNAAVNYPLSSPARNPQALAIADINQDQKPDILIVGDPYTATTNALMVFENKIQTPALSVTSQPISVYSVCDGATPTISTTATGASNITYQWQIFNTGSGSYVDLTNSGGYSNVSTASFTINSTGNFGAGTYRCKINGDFAATVYSNTVSFTVNALPSTPVTSNVSNCGSGSVVLTASGTSNGNYLWYDQNGLIAGQNNSTYTTPVISTTSFYSVAITNGTCVSPKVNITATILTSGCAPLSITNQPSDFSVCAGGVATFTTAAVGTANIIYQWQFSTGSAGPYSDIVNGGGYANANTPTLSVNTTGNFGAGRYRCKIDGDLATTIFTNDEGLFINPVPAVPTISNISSCGAASVTLTASGGSNGNYLWYDTNGLISGQINSIYITPVISSTTTYSVAIISVGCNSAKVIVTATINLVPTAPSTTGATACPGSTFILTASGGINGQYVWYTTSSGGAAIAGEVNSTYTTPALTTNTTYYVSINNGTCESARSPVAASVLAAGCSNGQPPVIASETSTTLIGATDVVSLLPLLSDPDNNLDLTTLKIVTQPTSGATATIDANHNLIVNYKGLSFAGTDHVTIEVCDLTNLCVQKVIDIKVSGEITIFNGISPNGANPKFIIQNIESLPETKDNTVHIFDRWENQVWHGTNYDNTSVVFTGVSDGGSDLPSGVYYYKINFSSGRKTETGFISLRRL